MKTDESKGFTKKKDGISVRVRTAVKSGKNYFIVDYRVNGARKLVWRSTKADAEEAALDAIEKIQTGNQDVLELTRTDRDTYLRAMKALDGLKGPDGDDVPLDRATSEYGAAFRLLGGRATIIEAAREWLKRNDVRVPRKTVSETCDDCLANELADGKSKARRKQLSYIFERFKRDHNMAVTQITTAHISQWLVGIGLSKRSRRNFRDVIGFLCRWAVLRGYLPKGTNWLEGVQNYSAAVDGEIEIYTPEELGKLICKADDRIRPLVVLQAFAGLRHAEAARTDWGEIDLDDGFIKVPAIKSKTNQRRLVPIHANLKSWLLPLRQEAGPICGIVNTTKQLLKMAKAAGVGWKHNGLRHSFISYRVAECADIARVAEEAGNSVQIIKGHYLQRVKPAEAAKWFAIVP